MLQKSFDVIHIEKINDRRIKLLIILFFNLFSKIKHHIFAIQFKFSSLHFANNGALFGPQVFFNGLAIGGCQS